MRTQRINKRNMNYRNLLQQFMHHNNYIKNINMYSFSLSPDSYQPGGKINFKHLGSITLDVNKKNHIIMEKITLHNILIYFRYYNILEIKSGMADLLFRN